MQRAKLCLDFACTCYFFNLCINWMYTGSFPYSIFWWIYCVSSTSILSAGSEYLCMNQELKPIILGKKQVDEIEMLKLNDGSS